MEKYLEIFNDGLIMINIIWSNISFPEIQLKEIILIASSDLCIKIFHSIIYDKEE